MADSDPPVIARIAGGVGAVAPEDWDRLAGPADPFLSHRFLNLLDDSASVGAGTGWQSTPIIVDDVDGRVAAIAPAYFKGHSRGEYVFDAGWADAWESAGGKYYPKLQIAVPFTPVPGRRLLSADEASARALIAAIEAVTVQNELSSAHATFVAADQLELFESADWLIRRDAQFHWHDRSYGDFEGFLGSLSSRRRKDIRKERAAAQARARIEILTGDAITSAHWDHMWACYQDTGRRKWGTPYLTREAFTLIGERMGDAVLMIVAHDRTDDRMAAVALNFIGADALYGRYWGCLVDIPCLHFELCYYQAIDAALAMGLTRVEAGAQGGHKLARGYEPVATWSAHFIPHPGFRAAIADFLVRERRSAEQEADWLSARLPFKQNG